MPVPTLVPTREAGPIELSAWQSAFVATPHLGPALFADVSNSYRLSMKRQDGSVAELVPSIIPTGADYIIKMVTTTAAAGVSKLRIFGQNVDTGSGGQVEIAGGFGTDTNGVQISERVAASETGTNPICQFFAQAGNIGQMTCIGGATQVFQQLGPGLAVMRIGSTTGEMILDAGTDLFIRVSNQANTVFRGGPGQTLAFHGTAPIAKQAITGAKAGNTAVAGIIAALVAVGLFTDSTT